jgi:hypothetical protein
MGCMGLGRRVSSPGGGRKEGEGEDPITTHHAGEEYEGGEADVQVQHPTPYSGRDMMLAIGLEPTEAGGQGKHGMGCLLEERRTHSLPLIRDLIRIVSSPSSSPAAVACKCTPREEVRGKGHGTRTDPLHLPADWEGGQEGNGTPWAV